MCLTSCYCNDGVALSFRVKDIHEACEYLKAKNVEIVSPPCSFADLGVTAALTRDPDGNLIELTQMGDMVGADVAVYFPKRAVCDKFQKSSLTSL